MFFLDLLFNRPKCRPGYTKLQKASTISRGSYIVIKNKPCQVITVEKNSFKLKFVAHDIFDRKEYTHQVKADADCECPIVYNTRYRITDISPDGQLSLITKNGDMRPPLSMSLVFSPPHALDCPTRATACGGDCHLDFLTRHRRRLESGQVLNALVRSSMGTEEVYGIEEWTYEPSDPPPE